MEDNNAACVPAAAGEVEGVGQTKAVDEDYEKAFQQHLVTAERAKSEYECLYREMVEKLSTSHLEPFNEVLLEHEDAALVDPDETLRKFKVKLLGQLLDGLDTSWKELNISNSIAKLEMLKERYKECETHNWNVAAMTPQERSLPLCVRYKEKSKRYLEIQIAQQNKQLEELLALNLEQRACIQEISKQRISLQETMEQNLEQKEQLKIRLQQLTEAL